MNTSFSGAYDGDVDSQLACFRLLYGREAVFARAGKLSDADVLGTMGALAKDSPLRDELRMQKLSVLSPSLKPNSPLGC